MPAKTTQTIKEKIATLDEYVAWFESDEFELEQALPKLAEAEKLAAAVEHDLQKLSNQIEVVKRSFDQD